MREVSKGMGIRREGMSISHEEYIQKAKCIRCGYEWYPRSPKQPKKCAKCGNPYWNRPRIKEAIKHRAVKE